jgi:hypothetical protein
VITGTHKRCEIARCDVSTCTSHQWGCGGVQISDRIQHIRFQVLLCLAYATGRTVIRYGSVRKGRNVQSRWDRVQRATAPGCPKRLWYRTSKLLGFQSGNKLQKVNSKWRCFQATWFHITGHSLHSHRRENINLEHEATYGRNGPTHCTSEQAVFTLITRISVQLAGFLNAILPWRLDPSFSHL